MTSDRHEVPTCAFEETWISIERFKRHIWCKFHIVPKWVPRKSLAKHFFAIRNKAYTEIFEEIMLTIRHCRKSLLFCTDKIWVKKSKPEFDVTIGSFGGAEICELVGFYILDQLLNILPVESFDLYRDNGLAILSGISGPDTEQIIKNIKNLFKTNNLKITIEAGMQKTDFLDVMFNADNGKYWPYEKPNSQLQYIHIQSPDIKKQLPKMIEKRLSGISCKQEDFDKAKPAYAHALQKSGYKQKLDFETENSTRKRHRKRNFTWFNSPFSHNISTNIGNKFLNLLDKHFLPNYKLYPICYRYCVIVSYSCMPNMAVIIKLHNSNVANPPKTDETKLAENCNCRNKSNSPLNGNCLKSCVVYKATVSSRNKRDDYY